MKPASFPRSGKFGDRLFQALEVVACILAIVGNSGGVVPAVTPAAKPAVNYPPPPVEGQSDYFAVAENGQAKCCLILPGEAKVWERAAAHWLKQYFKFVTGADFSVIAEDRAPAGLGQIHVGDTMAARQVPLDLATSPYGRKELPDVNGYLIKTVSPTLLVIRGVNQKATEFAAISLLKRYVGVRRYWPGEPGGLGDVIPKNTNLKLPQIEWRDWPCFISRTMSGLDIRGPKDPVNENATAFADWWRMHYTMLGMHSYFKLLKPQEHLNEPALFPLINGKRCVPDAAQEMNWQPCVSNLRVAEIMADSIKQFFRNHPDSFAFNLCVNDGRGDCTCEKCRALDAPGADPANGIGLCDRYIKFDNKVAELVAQEFPDKLLTFIAYLAMQYPPTTVRLHRMLVPVLCFSGNTFQMWDAWQKTGACNMGAYFYHDDVWFILPKLDIHQSAKRIRYLAASGLARHFYQEFYGLFPLDGMVGYVEQELLWDPRQSEDALLDEYYRTFFGKAAAPMKLFYGTLEAGYTEWLARVGKPHSYGLDAGSLIDSRSLNQFSVLTVALAAKAQASLEDALVTAGDDPQVVERIKLVKALYGFAVPGVRAHWACERLRNPKLTSFADAGRVVADAREAIDNMLALGEYKFAVMEKPEIKVYAEHPDTDYLYANLQRGNVPTDVVSGIGQAFKKVSTYLRTLQSPASVQAWWRQQQQTEQRPFLRDLMKMAAADAGGQHLKNLLDDPGFEKRGVQQPHSGKADDLETAKRAHVNVSTHVGNPVKCSLTNKSAHTGRYSLTFWDSQGASVFERIEVKPGDRINLSVWVKHNKTDASYTVEAAPQGQESFARTVIAVPNKPDEWQKIEISLVVPPDATGLLFLVSVKKQSPGAQIWVDDFFIGKKSGD